MADYNYPFPSYSWPYQGVDFASIQSMSDILAEQMYSDGIRFVGRYLYSSQFPNGKGISRAEAEIYLRAGIAIFLYYEVNTDDALGGWERGVTNGRNAYAIALALSVPKGTPIICCCDTSVTDAQASGVVMDYLMGFASEMPGYIIGIYGGLNVVHACYNAHPDFWRVQAGAWGAQEFSELNVRQWYIPRNAQALSDGYVRIANVTLDSTGYAKWNGNSVDLLSAPSLENMWGGTGPTKKDKMPLWFYLKKFRG